MVGDEGDQRNVPGPLNGGAERPLVLGAHAGAAAGLDLGPVGNEPPDPVDFLVIDVLDVLDAEGADPAAGREPPAGPPARPSSRSASSSAPALRSLVRPSWSSTRFGGHISVFPLLNELDR